MKADYDSEADALSIDLIEIERWQGSEIIDDDFCFVALAGGLPANINLLSPRKNLGLLKKVAGRFDLDHEAIVVAAEAALAAPDRPVVIDLLARYAGQVHSD